MDKIERIRRELAAVKRQARVQLEMGGKNPLVVLDDADFDRAVMCALDGAFFATGQRCTASSRIIVQDGIYNKFVAAHSRRIVILAAGVLQSFGEHLQQLVSLEVAKAIVHLLESVEVGHEHCQ